MIRAPRFLLPGLVAGVLGAQVHGVRTADLDTSAAPCRDLFQYANGGWIKANPIPPDRASWSAIDEVEARTGAVLREVLEDAAASRAPEGSVPRQVGDFFASGMDTASIARAGLAPLRDGLARIDAVRDLPGLGRELARLHLAGARAGFALTVGQDDRRSTVNIAQLAQGGLGMPDPHCYLAEGSRGLRAAYHDYLARLFALAGETPALARAHAGIAFDLERRLAAASMSLPERRDPVATYHRLSQEGLRALAPRFPWGAYFEAAGMGAPEDLLVRQPGFLAELSAMAADIPSPQWRVYLKARLLDASAPFLGEAFENAAFAFHGGTLEGTRQPAPRWRRVQRATDAALGEALGQMYVARAFSPRARDRARELAAQVRAALRERIPGLAWMTPPAREATLHKLDAMAVKVGYPDAWQDYSALKVDRAGYLANVQRAAAFGFRRQLALLGRPVDRGRWPVSPAAVNAWYEPRLNEIVLPAGILQPPFFDPRADDAANLGALGVVIGHEIAHGFDDAGRRYDAEGNLEAPPGLALDGRPAPGEDLADMGGLRIALAALEKTLEGQSREPAGGFTPEQRFFLGYAQSRRIHAREEAVRPRAVTDPRSPARDRVNATLANLPEFAAAFGCAAEGTLNRPQAQGPATR